MYFDDYKVRHVKSRLIQGNEYYPFGLQTANSWTRESVTGNNYLANGGTELNQTSQLYDLEFRNLDPALGRMFQVDPVAAKYASLTPYNYSFNSPIGFSDPSGADPDPEFDRIRNSQNYFHNGGGAYGQPGLTYDDYDPMTRLANGDFQCARCWDKDNLMGWFGGSGPGLVNYGNGILSFISRALRSSYGGSWSNGSSTFFESDKSALFAGVSYIAGNNGITNWWLVFADEGKSSSSIYIYFNTNFRSDFGDKWFGAYGSQNGGVEYGGRYHNRDVSDYRELGDAVFSEFSSSHGLGGEGHRWALAIDYLGNETGGKPGKTWPPEASATGRVTTYVDPAYVRRSNDLSVIMTHELKHTGDYLRGIHRQIWADLKRDGLIGSKIGSSISEGIMEARAYKESLHRAEGTRDRSLIQLQGKGYHDYSILVPERYVKKYLN